MKLFDPAGFRRRCILAAACLAPVMSLAQAPSAALSTEPQLRIEAGMHSAVLRRIATDAQGRYAVTASDDKTARVWDVQTGRLLRVLRPPAGPGDEGKLNAVAISPNGATVAVGGWTKLGSSGAGHTVYLLDRANGRLVRRLGALPNVINQLAFSPDGRWLAVALAEGGVRVWDWAGGDTAALADTGYGAASHGAAWSVDGRLATSSWDGKVRLYRVSSTALNKVAESSVPGGQRPLGLSFDRSGARLAVGYSDSNRVDVVDGHALDLMYSADSKGSGQISRSAVAWSADGQTLAAGGRNNSGKEMIRLWPDAGRGQPHDVATVASTVMGLAALPQGGWVLGAADPAWGVVSPDGVWQVRGTPPVADLRSHRRDVLLLADSGMQVQFGFELNGGAPHRFDVRRRSLEAGGLAAGIPPETTALPVSDWHQTKQPSLNGRALALQPDEIARSLAIAPGAASFVLGTSWWLRDFNGNGEQRWKQASPGDVWNVNIPRDGPLAGRVVVAAYADGTIRWHRLSDGQEVLAFFPHVDRKRWVLWTPSGYYDASPGGEDLIGWHVNRGIDQAADFFPASQFRSRFHRPDVIDAVLDTLDEGQALAKADAQRGRTSQQVTIAQALPPVVEVVGGQELRTAQAQVKLKVRARTAADAPVTGWQVRVNGQLQPEARGLMRADATADASAERELTVTVPGRDSEIQVFATNRHATSTPALVRVQWAGTPPASGAQAPGFQIQPKLYVLAVGVAQYQHAQIAKLGLPAKDARDFAAALLRQKGRLYRDVEVRVLTDQQATADAVVDGLDWLQKQVTQHDVGMVFLAGHGLNDPDLGYTYLPFNADPERLRRTGVAMEEFKKTLSALPGKAVFFFDTCHSGNVLGGRLSRGGGNDVSGVINELARAENGVVVFSSSTGRQLSYEDAAWGNGAFTKALVEGLDGKANYQGGGRITHKMLDLYISERVKQLTGGKQSPVTQAPGGVPDFPLALVR
jgi:WD40 repeat protein